MQSPAQLFSDYLTSQGRTFSTMNAQDMDTWDQLSGSKEITPETKKLFEQAASTGWSGATGPDDDGSFLGGLGTALGEMKGGLAVALGGPALGLAGTALAGGAAGAGAAGAAGSEGLGAGLGLTAAEIGGSTMPAAIAESSAALGSQGLIEASPGVWEAGGAIGGGGALAGAASAASTAGSAGKIASLLGITDSDLNILGKLGGAGVQAFSSNQQANSLEALAKKYDAYGAPSRARYEASMTPGFDPTTIPGYSGALDTTSKSLLAKLSATGGNPFGNPGGLIDANKQIVSGTAMPAINEYSRLNANTGFGTSMNAAGGFDANAIKADSGVLAALANGIGAVTAPDNSLEALLKKLQGGGFSFNTGAALA